MKKYKLRVGFYLFLIAGILTMLGFSCFNIWTQIYQNEQKVHELNEKYERLVDQEYDLSGQVNKLQDPEYVAKYAREKYLYTSDGEKIIDIETNK
ncbi:MAG: septum formation initiator family protein [Bacilli bacterium]|nr:septum formation initiator family protein [Bacilli bacterium]